MPMFRYLALMCLVLSFSGLAHAKKPEKSPIKQFQSHKKLKKNEGNYLTHRGDLTSTDLLELDRELIQSYGPPTSQRGRLKIWEISNPEIGVGQADKVTIMCGINPDGSKAFVIDARAPIPAKSLAKPKKTKKLRSVIGASNAKNRQINPNIQD